MPNDPPFYNVHTNVRVSLPLTRPCSLPLLLLFLARAVGRRTLIPHLHERQTAAPPQPGLCYIDFHFAVQCSKLTGVSVPPSPASMSPARVVLPPSKKSEAPSLLVVLLSYKISSS